MQLFEDGDRALIAADVAELSRIFADDYIQYDETGRPSTRQDLLKQTQQLQQRHAEQRQGLQSARPAPARPR